MWKRPKSTARSRTLLVLVGAMLVATSACSGGDTTSSDAGGGQPEAAGAEEPAAQAEQAEPADGPTGDFAAQAAGQADDAALGEGGAALPPPPPARAGDRVIKEGTVRVEVVTGAFDRSFQEVVAEARRLGGDVTASTTTLDGQGRSSGSMTVRVPVAAFEDLLVGVARIGEVRSRDVRSQDVSTEFVDLQSRLRHLQAQERFYLGLLDEAQVVGDAIAVQEQLEDIQGGIEQIRGRLTLLDDRTSFSRLTVELFEEGAAGTVALRTGTRRDLLGWWEAGLDAFVTMLGALLAGLLFALPLLIVAVPVVVALRALRRRRAARGQNPPVPSGAAVTADRDGPSPRG